MMRAARLHAPGMPLLIENVEIPNIRPDEVLVKVMACGIIPNMNRVYGNVVAYRLPPLPAIGGLDASGIVEAVGSEVTDVTVGERVYINPLLSCGTCHFCRNGNEAHCTYSALRGYFALRPKGVALLKRYPFGGFAEYTAIPARNLVKLPPEVSFEQAARFGYLGTAYAALKAGGVTGASWILLNGVTGTIGVRSVIWALALGATRILGLGRNRELLQKVKELSPRRIETLALGDEPIQSWAKSHTEGHGVDVVIDCTGRGSKPETTLEAMSTMKPAGVTVTVGALTDPLPLSPYEFMNHAYAYKGQAWFSVAQGEDMAELARVGAADLSCLSPQPFRLEDINQALDEIKNRPGGFTNMIVQPWR